MKTNLEQLQEILCTVESVEKDVKELRIGCKVIYNDNEITYTRSEQCEISDSWLQEQVFYFDSWKWWEFEFINNPSQTPYAFSDMAKIKKLWNPLTLKHLMMYCNEKGMIVNIYNWYARFLKNSFIWELLYKIEYDITKELYEQEDKVLLDIINFLKG